MKAYHLRALILLLALPATLFFQSCEKEDKQNTSDDPALKADYEMPGLDLIESPLVQDATADADFAILDDGMPADLDARMNEDMDLAVLMNHRPMRHCNRRHLLDSLNLSPTQVQQLKRAVVARYKCTHSLFVQIRSHNHQVLQRAHQARQQLLQDFHNGTITRQQLQRGLHQINQNARQALVTQADRARIVQALRDCHRDFLQHVNGILNKNQLRLWIAFHQRCAH